MSAPFPGLTPVIVESLHKVQVVNYFYFVTAAVLVYDHVLTFVDEISLVWPATWGLGKVLFILARYPPYIDMAFVLFHQLAKSPSVKLCHDSYRIAGWANLIGISCTEVILIMRTWALWSKDIRVVAGLVVLGAGCLGAACFILNLFLESMTFIFIANISPQLSGCFISGGSKLVYVAFIILIIFETVVLALTLFIGVKHYRQEFNKSSFVSSIFRNGIVYYLYLFVFSFLNVIIPLKAPRESIQFLIELQRIMHSICACRILLQIRQAGSSGKNSLSRGTTDASLSTGIMLDTLPGSNVDLGAHLITPVPREDGVPELENSWKTHPASQDTGWFGGCSSDVRGTAAKSAV